MSKIPIPNNEFTSIDPCYRYMRSRLQVNPTKKCNVMTNLFMIAKQLQIDESMFLSYLQKETGQKVIEVDKGKYGIKSKTESEIEDLLESFIQTHIICKNCGLPELNLIKKDDSYGVCNSCGHSNCEISEVSESKKRSKKSKKSDNKIAKKDESINPKESDVILSDDDFVDE